LMTRRELKKPKYPDLKRKAADPRPMLSASDARELARIVGKYGRDTVVGAIESGASPRPVGRPTLGLFPIYKAMHLADWFEDRVEEHLADGSRSPYKDATLELYDLRYSREEQVRGYYEEVVRGRKVRKKVPSPTAFYRTIKKTRLRGRRELEELLRKTIEKRPATVRDFEELEAKLASLESKKVEPPKAKR
jgi:hypothetical protein